MRMRGRCAWSHWRKSLSCSPISASKASRSFIQVVQDDKNTTGIETLRYDLNTIDFVAGESVVGFIFGGNDASFQAEFRDDPTQLQQTFTADETWLGTVEYAFDTDESTSGFETISGNIDFGATGFDYLAVGFYGFYDTDPDRRNDYEVYIDNVTVVTEPGTSALFAGALGLMLVSRRRRA